MKIESKFIDQLNPQERKAFDLASIKHLGMSRKHGSPYITHPLAVAEYLDQHDYGSDYICTAFCHDILEDTDTLEEELIECCGEYILAAVKLLTKFPGFVMKDYMDEIRKNEIAYTVKVADRIHNLREATLADIEFQKQYLEDTENNYLDFAKDSPFFDDLWNAYSNLKKEASRQENQFHDLMKLTRKLYYSRILDQMPAPEKMELPEGYDRFEVLIRRERILATREVWNCCDLYINGERFIDIVNRNMLMNGYPRHSGDRYIGLPPRHVLSPCIDFIDMEHGFKHHDERRVQTLACKDCGIAECSTVPVLITVDDKKVTWSEIGHYPDTMGSYTFLRTQYEHALDHGNAAYYSAYHHANGIQVKRNRTMMLEMFMEAVEQGSQQAAEFISVK